MPASKIDGLAFLPDNATPVYPYNSEIKLFDVSSYVASPTVSSAHSDWWTSLAYEPRTNRLAATRGMPFNPKTKGNFAIWRIDGSDCHRLESRVSPPGFDISASRNRIQFVSAYDDLDARGSLELLNASDGKLIATFREQENGYTAVAVSPDGDLIAGGSWFGNMSIWDIKRQTIVQRFRVPQFSFKSIVFVENGATLLAGGGRFDYGEIHCWDLRSGKKTRVLKDLGELVVGLAVSPNGEQLAIGTWDGSVQLWRLTDFARRTVCAGHQGWASSVSFSPDGLRLASGGMDRQVRLWDIETGSQVCEFVFDEWVTDVAFVDHGNAIAAGLADGTLMVWHQDGTRSTLRFAE